MTATEMSLAFDRLYDNIMSNQAPGLNEYEKSCFLTEAQETLAIELYNMFEVNEAARVSLAPLLKTVSLGEGILEDGTITDYSYVFTLPDDVWYKVWEGATICDEDLACKGKPYRKVEVVPCKLNDLSRTVDNPFRGPNERRVLRLDMGDGLVEIVSKYEISDYMLRYVAKPAPIITADLSNTGLTIDSKTAVSEPTLPESTHAQIVRLAVQSAKAVWFSTGVEQEDDKD